MSDRRTIAFFPEASFGAALNCVGIAQRIRELGHDAVFICDIGFAETFESYGFRTFPIAMSPKMSEEEIDKFWMNFIERHRSHFRLPPEEQLGTYTLPSWEAIVDSAILAEPHLERQLAIIRPDVMCIDNVILFPAAIRTNCPWVRIMSCAETEIPDPAIPPHMSGMGATETERFEAFRTLYNDTMQPAHDRFTKFLRSVNLPAFEPGQFLGPSPYLNLLLYTDTLRFERDAPLDPRVFRYLEGCVRKEIPYEIPDFPANNDKPIVYVSFGSLGAVDISLFERMIRLFSTLPYRFLVNAGGYRDSYRFVPDNVHIDYWYPQPSVVDQIDVFIHHGGNNSVHEALYFGVPSIIMPYCWDGHDNATRMQETDVGIHLPRYDWRDAELSDAIDTLVADKDRLKRLAKISADMQDADGRNVAATAILELAGADSVSN